MAHRDIMLFALLLSKYLYYIKCSIVGFKTKYGETPGGYMIKFFVSRRWKLYANIHIRELSVKLKILHNFCKDSFHE